MKLIRKFGRKFGSKFGSKLGLRHLGPGLITGAADDDPPEFEFMAVSL